MKGIMTTMVAVSCLLCGCAEKQQETFTRSVVLTEPVRLGTESVKSFSGIVQEAHEISLGFKTPGQIERIAVKEGDYVRQGQLIARLDDADYKLGVEAAQIQYDQMKNEVARMKKLYDEKSLSGNDYEKAVAGLQQLKVQLQTNQNKLDYTRLYAPVDGYVQSVNFEPAEMVDAGTPIVNLLDVKRMEVEVDIPASLFVQRDRFTGFFCQSAFTGGEELPMKLISITPKADGNQLYRMRLVFDGADDKRLTAGMNVEIGIRIAGSENAGFFTLPLHTLFREKENTYVWVLGNDTTVVRREVTVDGTDASGNAVITSGLNGDERVIKAGVNALQENEKVRVIEEPAETNVGGLI
ncbi:MAG: efflux RND transporter periplasmic adaptor subunit [Bacteroidales bacterium]|nr:efflux RND transporter periplasmic adaptor subunit [Bacteroidales bacterium]